VEIFIADIVISQGTQRYEDLLPFNPNPLSRPPLRRKTSVLAKLGGTIRNKVRSMSTPVRSSMKVEGSTTSLVRSQQATTTHSVTPALRSNPIQISKSIAESPVIPPPPQNSLAESPQIMATDAIWPPTISRRVGTDEERDDLAYVTPVTSSESFELPSPLSNVSPRSSLKKFQEGKESLPFSFEGDEMRDEE
jgi:hypothetical protein